MSKVKVIAIDVTYKEKPYLSVPKFDAKMDNFLTGQHYDPAPEKNQDPGKRLLKEELLKKEGFKITQKKRELFPFIIFAEDTVAIRNLDVIDTATPRGKAIYEYLKLQDVVANTKEEIIPRRHYFYLHDEKAHAKKKNDSRKIFFEIGNRLAKLDYEHLLNVALFMNYFINDFKVNPKAEEDIMRNRIMDYLQNNTQRADVIETMSDMFKKSSEPTVFVLRCINDNIIKLNGRDQSFYDGSQYLGRTPEEIVGFMNTQEGSTYRGKWIQQFTGKSLKEFTNSKPVHDPNGQGQQGSGNTED